MEATDAERRLAELWGEIHDLQSTQQLLDWDQETQMPAGAHEARAKMGGTVAALKHRLLTAEELWQTIEACADAAAPVPAG